ncbi:MAG: HAD family hydrolase [Pseudomonadota bacterium]
MTVFEQNRIALIWDFDKTLTPRNMQTPLFNAFGVDQKSFWEEVNALPFALEAQGHRVNHEIYYLNHILTCVRSGIFKGLNNAMLRNLGREIQFFPGVLNFFKAIKTTVEQDPKFSVFDIKVEHYIVSTGLTEMIKGSAVMDLVDDVWGCEFMEDRDGILSQIIFSMDNTTKTKAVFEINKGVNKHPGEINVNSLIPENERRVPFRNMIYVADGPSDIPAFSVVKRNGGQTFALYNPDDDLSFVQADNLRLDGRVHMYGPADFRDGTLTSKWLKQQAVKIAESIVDIKKSVLKKAGERIPVHTG